MTESRRPGWQVSRSIALELDAVLSVLGPDRSMVGISAEAAEMIRAVPADWKAQWTDLLGPARPWIGLLSAVAGLAGVLEQEDYTQATLAMRELTLAGALQRAGAAPDETLPQTVSRLGADTLRQLGLSPAVDRQAAQEALQASRILRDGDLHARFWLWLDRFYFEFYRPWREAKLPGMALREQEALARLGAREGDGTAPALDWLPPQNPAVLRPELREAVAAGRVRVLFWTDPFGFFDFWSLQPGLLIVGYGTPSVPVVEFFRTEAESIAERAKAVSDPTRLMILRIIRTFGMDNTQMADYLGIARPTVSIHAKALRDAGLIDTRHQGRAAMHSLNPGAIRQLFRDLEQFLQLGEEDHKVEP